MSYHPSITGILLVDPYNDFLNETRKVWPRAKAIAEKVTHEATESASCAAI